MVSTADMLPWSSISIIYIYIVLNTVNVGKGGYYELEYFLVLQNDTFATPENCLVLQVRHLQHLNYATAQNYRYTDAAICPWTEVR